MKKNVLIPAALTVILLFLIFFEPLYGWQVRNFFEPRPGEKAELDFRLENEKLKAEIAKFKIIKSQASDAASNYAPAMVYSRYPFNFKNELLINIGKNNNVLADKPVVFGGVLFGKVLRVFEETSLIQTLFDSKFQLAVGIGGGGARALLRGGSLPALSLIPLSAQINEGDIVYSVSPDFPYGLPIGEVHQITLSSDHLFREASLKFAYDVNEVKAVLVRKQ